MLNSAMLTTKPSAIAGLGSDTLELCRLDESVNGSKDV